jgi:hypothetical protein
MNNLNKQNRKPKIHLEIRMSLLRDMSQAQDILKHRFSETSMETMSICLKEIAQSKEDIRKLLKKHHHQDLVRN